MLEFENGINVAQIFPEQGELAIKDYELYHPEAERIRVWQYYQN